MVFKIPVRSLQFFVDIHAHYAFSKIRASHHPRAEEIVNWLYEILFLQQKTAIALSEFARSADYVREHKGSAMMIAAEVDAIMGADRLFSYLKACVEKTIALVGVVHGIDGLENKKTHRARMNVLREALDKQTKETPYKQMLIDLMAPENLEELNDWRLGLLHRKGVSDLQPHSYTSVEAADLPLRGVFAVMHEQHTKNSAVLLAALAMLTDKLVELDPPDLGETVTGTSPAVKDGTLFTDMLNKVARDLLAPGIQAATQILREEQQASGPTSGSP